MVSSGGRRFYRSGWSRDHDGESEVSCGAMTGVFAYFAYRDITESLTMKAFFTVDACLYDLIGLEWWFCGHLEVNRSENVPSALHLLRGRRKLRVLWQNRRLEKDLGHSLKSPLNRRDQ